MNAVDLQVRVSRVVRAVYTERGGYLLDESGICVGVLPAFDWSRDRVRPVPALARACLGARWVGAVDADGRPVTKAGPGACLLFVGRDAEGRTRRVRTPPVLAFLG
jgi:hypothetical protein